MKHEHLECQWSLVALHIVRTYSCVLCGNQISKKKTISLVGSLAHLIGGCKVWECFKCKSCEKTFGQRNTLSVHNRVHTGWKPYQCVLCKSCFFTFAGLELHKKIYCTSEKSFTVMKTKSMDVPVHMTRSKSNIKGVKHVGKASKATFSKSEKTKMIQKVTPVKKKIEPLTQEKKRVQVIQEKKNASPVIPDKRSVQMTTSQKKKVQPVTQQNKVVQPVIPGKKKEQTVTEGKSNIQVTQDEKRIESVTLEKKNIQPSTAENETKLLQASVVDSIFTPEMTNNIKIKEEETDDFPIVELKQNVLNKQTLIKTVKDISPFVQTVNSSLSKSFSSQAEATKEGLQHLSVSYCQMSKHSLSHEPKTSQENIECGSDTDLTASKKLKALADLSEEADEHLPVSVSVNTSVTLDTNEAKVEEIQSDVDMSDDDDTPNSPVSDIDKIFDSEDSDIAVEEFQVSSKDHKYNTRHRDPKKSYKKLLPRLKNEMKRVKGHKCTLCPQSFFSKDRLQMHLTEHKKKRIKEYHCDVCTKMFHNKFKLDVHKQIHTGEKPYICEDCDMSFSSKEKLSVHNRIHTGEKPYRCDCCPKEFRCRTYLRQHKQIHRSGKDYRCLVCDKGFHMEKYLKNHMATAQIQICHICKKTFCSASQLNSHVKNHGEDYPYPCELCKKRFKVQNNYLLHCRVQHNIGEAPPLRKYACDLCSSSFHKHRQMTVHMENVHNKTKEPVVLICPWSHCGRKFTSDKRLNIHVRSHNGEKSYLCYKCGVNFKDYVYFRKHRARCLQKRKGAFACDICGTVLTEMGSLRVHKRIHTGEKPYRCDICGTWFRTPSHLNRHRLIHLRSKDKPVRRRSKFDIAQQKPFANAFVLKTEKEDADNAMSLVAVESRHSDQLEFVETGVPSEMEDRKPIFDTTGVQTMSTTDVNDLLFASQIVEEVMATSHIKKEPNETHYIVISQDPDATDENQQVTYITRENNGILPDDQITYITQGQDDISDEQVTFITQGQEIILPDGQITYVTEAQDTSLVCHDNTEFIGDIHELQRTPSEHSDEITFSVRTSSESDPTRYVVLNPEIHETSVAQS